MSLKELSIQEIHKLPWEKFLEASVEKGHGYYLFAIYNKALETKAKTIVELGAGWSTRALLKAAIKNEGHLYSIELSFRPSFDELLKSGGDHLDMSFWTFIQGNDLEIAKKWILPIDFLFIDTGGTPGHAFKELEAYSKFMVEDGVILLHNSRDPPIKRGIDEFIKKYREWEFEDVTPAGDGWGLALVRRK